MQGEHLKYLNKERKPMTRKFIDQELSEILGASVGNVVFIWQRPSEDYEDIKDYVAGIQRVTLSFNSFVDLLKYNPEGEYGSIKVILVKKHRNEYIYEAICVYGEETARLGRAIASGLSLIN